MIDKIKEFFIKFFRINRTSARKVRLYKKYEYKVIAIKYNKPYTNESDTIIGKLTYDKYHKYFDIEYPYSITNRQLIALTIGLSVKYDSIESIRNATDVENYIWRTNKLKYWKNRHIKYKLNKI